MRVWRKQRSLHAKSVNDVRSSSRLRPFFFVVDRDGSDDEPVILGAIEKARGAHRGPGFDFMKNNIGRATDPTKRHASDHAAFSFDVMS